MKKVVHPEEYEEYLEWYWDYYSSLEKDYLSLNMNSDYSIPAIKLYLSIGSEIDVLFQVICKCGNEGYNGNNICSHKEEYKKLVEDNIMDDIDVSMKCISDGTVLSPWHDYKNENDVLLWWKHYNEIKHSRILLSNGHKGYEYATKDNLKSALSALYILEVTYGCFLNGYSIEKIPSSTLFMLVI